MHFKIVWIILLLLSGRAFGGISADNFWENPDLQTHVTHAHTACQGPENIGLSQHLVDAIHNKSLDSTENVIKTFLTQGFNSFNTPECTVALAELYEWLHQNPSTTEKLDPIGEALKSINLNFTKFYLSLIKNDTINTAESFKNIAYLAEDQLRRKDFNEYGSILIFLKNMAVLEKIPAESIQKIYYLQEAIKIAVKASHEGVTETHAIPIERARLFEIFNVMMSGCERHRHNTTGKFTTSCEKTSEPIQIAAQYVLALSENSFESFSHIFSKEDCEKLDKSILKIETSKSKLSEQFLFFLISQKLDSIENSRSKTCMPTAMLMNAVNSQHSNLSSGKERYIAAMSKNESIRKVFDVFTINFKKGNLSIQKAYITIIKNDNKWSLELPPDDVRKIEVLSSAIP